MTASHHDLRCPKCLGELDPQPEQLICRNCRAPYPVTGGIHDLRCGSGDYYFNPVPPAEMERLVQNMTRENWTETLRTFVNHTRAGPAWLDNLVINGRYAWKLLLDLNRESVVLDLGCGLGNLTHNLAPFVRKVYALDLTYLRLAFSKKRFEMFNADDDICLIAGGDGRHLPLRDDSLDCVVLSGVLEWVGVGDTTPFTEGSKPARLLRMLAYDFGGNSPREVQLRFLKEIRRVVKPQGQVFVAIENRLGYEYFTGYPDHHSGLKYSSLLPRFAANLYSIARARTPYRTYTYSIPGHKRLFAEAGFPNTEFLGFQRGYTQLEEIQPAEIDAPWWTPAPASGFKERLRRNKYFVPAYGVIGSAAPKPWRRLQDELFRIVERDLAAGEETLKVESYNISIKDKLLVHARCGESNVVIKVPFRPAAQESEEQNARMLRILRSDGRHEVPAPRPLAAGKAGILDYFVEERLPGIRLATSNDAQEHASQLQVVSALLDALHAAGGGTALRPFTDELYEREVTRRLDRLGSVVPDPAQREQVRAFFHRTLNGVPTAVGIFHGDFNPLNILASDGRVTGLVDWEGGSEQGLPILDVMTYLAGARMQRQPGERLDSIVPLLASGRWPDPRESTFLRERYERLGMDIARHEAWAYLSWLHGVNLLLQTHFASNPQAVQRNVTDVLNSMLRLPAAA